MLRQTFYINSPPEWAPDDAVDFLGWGAQPAIANHAGYYATQDWVPKKNVPNKIWAAFQSRLGDGPDGCKTDCARWRVRTGDSTRLYRVFGNYDVSKKRVILRRAALNLRRGDDAGGLGHGRGRSGGRGRGRGRGQGRG